MEEGTERGESYVQANREAWNNYASDYVDAGYKGWATEEHRVAALVWEGTSCPYVALPEVTREGLTR